MGPRVVAFDPADYRRRLLIADGDYQAELVARGWPRGKPVWVVAVNQPELLRTVAGQFLDAGAEVLVAPTDGASELGGIGPAWSAPLTRDEVLRVNRRAAEIFREAVSDDPGGFRPVLGAIGPTDRMLVLGEVDEATLASAWAAQAEALAAGGVDALLLRSFTELAALRVAVRTAIKATKLPVIGGMRFEWGPDRLETALGATASAACDELREAGAIGVGCETGELSDQFASVVGVMRQATDLLIWAQVNAGMPELRDASIAYAEKPKDFAKRLRPLANAGANFVAGGVGAGVEHMAGLVAERRAMHKSRKQT